MIYWSFRTNGDEHQSLGDVTNTPKPVMTDELRRFRWLIPSSTHEARCDGLDDCRRSEIRESTTGVWRVSRQVEPQLGRMIAFARQRLRGWCTGQSLFPPSVARAGRFACPSTIAPSSLSLSPLISLHGHDMTLSIYLRHRENFSAFPRQSPGGLHYRDPLPLHVRRDAALCGH